jgi:biopolymer transport protein ExbD
MSRGRGKKHDLGDEEAEEELNLIPYLDIVTNLVIFLVFSFEVILEFRLINVVPPEIGPPGPSDSNNEPPKGITTLIHEGGYTILPVNTSFDAVDIARKPDGSYDVEKLHSELVRLKREYGLGRAMQLMAYMKADYKVVVQTMDAARNDGEKSLFPDVKLARAGGAI